MLTSVRLRKKRHAQLKTNSRWCVHLTDTTMSSHRPVEILPHSGLLAGENFFSDPLPSDETLIAEVFTSEQPQLFCHRQQTDQLIVLRGSIDLIVLQNRHLRSITLREDEATWVRIPAGVPHGAINRSSHPAVIVNAVLRHGPSDPRDYHPRPVPRALLNQWDELIAG